jgi:hypothetical protein
MSGRIFKTLALSLVLGAIFAGSAAASVMIQPSDFGSAQATQPVVSEKTAGLYPATHPLITATRPLISEKLGGLQLQTQSETPLVSEKVGGLGLQSQPQTTVSASNGTEFDWGDAGIGAGVVSAALIAAMAATLAVRSKSRQGRLAH